MAKWKSCTGLGLRQGRAQSVKHATCQHIHVLANLEAPLTLVSQFCFVF